MRHWVAIVVLGVMSLGCHVPPHPVHPASLAPVASLRNVAGGSPKLTLLGVVSWTKSGGENTLSGSVPRELLEYFRSEEPTPPDGFEPAVKIGVAFHQPAGRDFAEAGSWMQPPDGSPAGQHGMSLGADDNGADVIEVFWAGPKWKTVDILCDWCGTVGAKIGNVTYARGVFATDVAGLSAKNGTREGLPALVLKGRGVDTSRDTYMLVTGSGPNLKVIGSSAYDPPGTATVALYPREKPQNAYLYRSPHTVLRLKGVPIR